MSRRTWALLLAPVCLAYLPILWGQFNFDDIATLLRNGSLGDWGEVLHNFIQPHGRALFWLTVNLDQALWGLSPSAFHATNLLIHLLNTALLTSLAERLARTRGESRPGLVGLCAGLLFGLHPLMSSAACYISQRSTMMAATALLAALHALLTMLSPDLAPGRRRLMGAAALGAWLAGYLCKENAGVIPFCSLAFFLAVPRKRDPGDESARAWLILTGLGTVALGIVEIAAGMRVPYQRATWDIYALTQTRVIWCYLRLWALPFHQSVDPDVMASTGWTSPTTTLFGGLALAALALALLMQIRRFPWLAAGGLMTLIALLPESSVIGLPDRMFEYRMYVPALGLTLAAAPLLSALAGRRPLLAWSLLAVFGLLAEARCFVWQSDPRLWREAVRHAPHKLRAQANLANGYASLRHLEAAEKIIHRAIRIKPMAEQYRDLASLALQRRDDAAGLSALQKAFELEPGRADCLPLLGRLHLASERYAEAADVLGQAFKQYPDDESLVVDLVTALVLSGRGQEATALVERLHGGDSPQSLLTLGTLLGSHNALPEAAQCLIRYTLRQPQDPVGWANLCQVYDKLGQKERSAEARRRAIRACGMSPDYAVLKHTLETAK